MLYVVIWKEYLDQVFLLDGMDCSTAPVQNAMDRHSSRVSICRIATFLWRLEMKKTFTTLLALTLFSAMASNAAAITLLTEGFEQVVTNSDINNIVPRKMIGVSFNTNNPIVANGAQGGNVLNDQGGFGGTYGLATNAGKAARVRSTNGAMLTEAALQLVTLNMESIVFSFDLKQVSANQFHVVEYSTDAAFTAPVLLDTITGLGSSVGLWETRSYTLVDGVGVNFTDDFFFRIRKMRPQPAGTVNGANNTFHVYDNILITGVERQSAAAVPEPATATLALLGLGGLMMRRRRDLKA